MSDEVPQFHIVVKQQGSGDVLCDTWLPSVPQNGSQWIDGNGDTLLLMNPTYSHDWQVLTFEAM